MIGSFNFVFGSLSTCVKNTVGFVTGLQFCDLPAFVYSGLLSLRIVPCCLTPSVDNDSSDSLQVIFFSSVFLTWLYGLSLPIPILEDNLSSYIIKGTFSVGYSWMSLSRSVVPQHQLSHLPWVFFPSPSPHS